MFDAHRPYAIHWELTDLCNLKCPMCPRTDHLNRCQPVPTIQSRQFSLAEVSRHMPAAFFRQVKAIDFCGNFGDPCATREFYEICALLIRDYKITLTVSTNGSMRKPDWWQKLGALFARTQCLVEFHIDGLEDTNPMYRIGADWSKIMANTQAYLSSGASADWLFIVFKHNQHQIDQACAMARQMGFRRFVTVATGRFPHDRRFGYLHPDGTQRYLEKADPRESRMPACGPEDRLIPAKEGLPARQTVIPGLGPINGIRCKSSKHNRFYLDAAGYLSPCCWVSNFDDQRPGNMLKAVERAGRDLKDFNIFHRPIADIVHDSLFSEVFPGLWGEDVLETCRKKCGRQHRNIRARIDLGSGPER
jgi:MoaA/NifB/PqqE/SkfB family radical SAM enzyme